MIRQQVVNVNEAVWCLVKSLYFFHVLCSDSSGRHWLLFTTFRVKTTDNQFEFESVLLSSWKCVLFQENRFKQLYDYPRKACANTLFNIYWQVLPSSYCDSKHEIKISYLKIFLIIHQRLSLLRKTLNSKVFLGKFLPHFIFLNICKSFVIILNRVALRVRVNEEFTSSEWEPNYCYTSFDKYSTNSTVSKSFVSGIVHRLSYCLFIAYWY